MSIPGELFPRRAGAEARCAVAPGSVKLFPGDLVRAIFYGFRHLRRVWASGKIYKCISKYLYRISWNPAKSVKNAPSSARSSPVLAGTFKALGDLTRLQIIYLLSTDTGGALGVSELAARLGYRSRQFPST